VKSTLVTPHGAFLIWNYVDRINADGAVADVHDTEPMIVGMTSVISMSTSKTKSAPAGGFEVRLAPDFNWVTKITPGSWCAILMSQNEIPNLLNSANKNSFKMLGRIDSVRGVISVDQQTGARQTAFVVTGQDWGSVFNTVLYIDAGIAENTLKGDALAQAHTILNFNMFNSFAEKKGIPNPSKLVDDMIGLWGYGAGAAIVNGEKLLEQASAGWGSKILLSTRTQYQMPTAVAEFMQQQLTSPQQPTRGVPGWNKLIQRQHGVLPGYDDPDKTGFNYKKIEDSYGFPSPDQLIGQHSLWQLLNDVSNHTLYELISDIRWDGDVPKFTLYHRIRPFVNRKAFLDSYAKAGEKDAVRAKTTVDPLVSLFSNVRRISIPLEDVVDINFGTNWRDKINFIEVRANSQLMPETQGISAKLNGQTVDRRAYERDGFKPYFATSAFIPLYPSDDKKTLAIEQLSHWKFLLREWYFNTHMMLNGSVTCIGQNNYIQVGDNIIIDSQVLGNVPFNATQKKENVFFLAHVESVMHSFAINAETGARTFTTTIQFVRGILSTSDGIIVGVNEFGTFIQRPDGAIDRSADSLTNENERSGNVITTATVKLPASKELKLGKPQRLPATHIDKGSV